VISIWSRLAGHAAVNGWSASPTGSGSVSRPPVAATGRSSAAGYQVRDGVLTPAVKGRVFHGTKTSWLSKSLPNGSRVPSLRMSASMRASRRGGGHGGGHLRPVVPGARRPDGDAALAVRHAERTSAIEGRLRERAPFAEDPAATLYGGISQDAPRNVHAVS
jgi:hypothetical protein